MLIASDIQKTYRQGDTEIQVLRGLHFQVSAGETVSIVGPSGGGKSTLLSILSGVDRPTTGRVTVDGKDLASFSEDELTSFRGRNYGIIFQQFHLISHLTALENVMLPLEILNERDAQDRARLCLQEAGLGQRVHHKPSQLSGGEAQRVAIARALVLQPKLLLADEPSGNLDLKTGASVMDLLFSLVEKHRTTLLLVTHSPELARRCQKKYVLENGGLRELS